MIDNFFPQRPPDAPMIYAYEENNPDYQGLLKVGYTTIEVERRVAQQYPTKRPDGKPLCDYNSETTPANNLGERAEEKQDVSKQKW